MRRKERVRLSNRGRSSSTTHQLAQPVKSLAHHHNPTIPVKHLPVRWRLVLHFAKIQKRRKTEKRELRKTKHIAWFCMTVIEVSLQTDNRQEEETGEKRMKLQRKKKKGKDGEWRKVRRKSSPLWNRRLHRSPRDFRPVERCVSSVGAHLSCSVEGEGIMQVMIYGMLTMLPKYVHFHMVTRSLKPHSLKRLPTHCDQWSWTGLQIIAFLIKNEGKLGTILIIF